MSNGNGIQPTQKHLSIDWIESNNQTESVKKGNFLGRRVVQINPNEREQSRTNSKLELGETLSILANTELANSILRFEKDANTTQSLLNRKVQVIATSRPMSQTSFVK
ncbi:T3SS regulon translocated regulator ExsE2 [Grimontia sp. NTOU-MAR1]|uniref:T3SS regulon translocated regulator ExsE2 n=1 Tax=Grimontia sp. NTOU-MAR1 TaxID=3111011 RepID=UPI002DBC3F97|nr:T3SS regulon translocated regulator ExsE2 [Grimontia sp. NTOU-MAR1]WRW00196.1 T3SS regulon translocated regulator ExsE2 [Grimontia sp. NTOU-MAR1]